jgi:hypothetical protein
MKGIITAAILVAALTPVNAKTKTAPADLVQLFNSLNEMCRGWPGDDKHIGEACDARNLAYDALLARGFCYRHHEGDWYACSKAEQKALENGSQ